MNFLLWELLLLLGLCSLGLTTAAGLRAGWPGYLAAALVVPFGVIFTADTGVNDSFRDALEVSADGHAFVWSAYVVMGLFAASLIIASRRLSNPRRLEHRQSAVSSRI